MRRKHLLLWNGRSYTPVQTGGPKRVGIAKSQRRRTRAATSATQWDISPSVAKLEPSRAKSSDDEEFEDEEFKGCVMSR